MITYWYILYTNSSHLYYIIYNHGTRHMAIVYVYMYFYFYFSNSRPCLNVYNIKILYIVLIIIKSQLIVIEMDK